MADDAPCVHDGGRAAIVVLRRARSAVVHPSRDAGDVARALAAVDGASRSLAAIAAAEDCPEKLQRAVLDWRDRLGSHHLAATALADLDVHPDLALQLLRRGLDEAIDGAQARALDLRTPTVASTPE